MQNIELLSPAKDAEIGIEAFRHGADAVYIGAPRFSARVAAGNSIDDIARMVRFGHMYGRRTFVAFNTLLRDEELQEAEALIWQLYEAGVDALIIQDMGILRMNLPPIELHASTQMDIRTPEKARLLYQMGFSRVVLARELSIKEIKAIHESVPEVELEVFVHGALCVCYSGQCYLSAALTGRSANRGECAQPCRLPMDLIDANGKIIMSQKHLLSLRDMNRSDYLQDLIDAGVTSLKIEGRLKDITYVKNVVAYYRQRLNAIGVACEDRITYTFEPNPSKSFNRGFTSYFADGKRETIWNFESPKSLGESIGIINKVDKCWFSLQGKEVRNGDGLVCDSNIGFRANKVDADGRIFPLDGNKVCRFLKVGMKVNRNLDYQFEQQLNKPSADRRVGLAAFFKAMSSRLELELVRQSCKVSVCVDGCFDLAQKVQDDNIRKQLSKLGDTIYELRELSLEGCEYFVPSSVLAQLRRKGIEALEDQWSQQYDEKRKSYKNPDYSYRAKSLDATSILPVDYKANVLNRQAREMFQMMGIGQVQPAFEYNSVNASELMQTKHCLKFALGKCPKFGMPQGASGELSTISFREPLSLKIGNEKFILKFGCKNACISEIFRIFAPD